MTRRSGTLYVTARTAPNFSRGAGLIVMSENSKSVGLQSAVMDRSRTHEVLARQTVDDLARAQFIIGLKRYLRNVAKSNETAFTRIVEPRFRSQNGRNPETIEEVGEEMAREPYYRLWSALTRTAQDMMWETVEGTVKRDLPRMLDAAGRLTHSDSKKGSLSLDPEFAVPGDVLVAHTHCQPGGYM